MKTLKEMTKKFNLMSLIHTIPVIITVVLLLMVLPIAFKRHIKFSRPGYYFDNITKTLYYRYYSDWFIFVDADWEEIEEDPELKDFEHTYTYNIKWKDTHDFKESQAYRNVKERVLSIDFNNLIHIDNDDLKPFIIFNDDVLNTENYE